MTPEKLIETLSKTALAPALEPDECPSCGGAAVVRYVGYFERCTECKHGSSPLGQLHEQQDGASA